MSDEYPDQLVAAALYYCRALLRSTYKKKYHRRASEDEVEVCLVGCIRLGVFDYIVQTELRALADKLAHITIRRSEFFSLAEDYFRRLSDVVDPPRGRPWKRRGIVADMLYQDSGVSRGQRRERRHSLERAYAADVAGTLLKDFVVKNWRARPNAVTLAHIEREKVDIRRIMHSPLSPEHFREFCDRYGLDRREQDALRKRIRRHPKLLSPNNLESIALRCLPK